MVKFEHSTNCRIISGSPSSCGFIVFSYSVPVLKGGCNWESVKEANLNCYDSKTYLLYDGNML